MILFGINIYPPYTNLPPPLYYARIRSPTPAGRTHGDGSHPNLVRVKESDWWSNLSLLELLDVLENVFYGSDRAMIILSVRYKDGSIVNY